MAETDERLDLLGKEHRAYRIRQAGALDLLRQLPEDRVGGAGIVAGDSEGTQRPAGPHDGCMPAALGPKGEPLARPSLRVVCLALVGGDDRREGEGHALDGRASELPRDV